MQPFYLPTEVVTGCGCLSQLGKVAARYGKRAMIVCGTGFVRRTGLLDRVVKLLKQGKLQATVFDRVTGEAELPVVEAGIALARKEACQVFVGLGGGSAMDTAKAIAGLVGLPGSVWEYHGGRKLEGPGHPFLAVPTTAGTGAEVTKNAVLIDPKQGVKKSIRDNGWFARTALVDPELTVTMPPQVTASTGSDALCQAIESFTSLGAGPVTDALARRAIELIGRSLLSAYRSGDDLAARENMSMASLMAGMAMASARLGAVHGIAHPLGSHYRIPHGVVCGLLLPHVMEYNLASEVDPPGELIRKYAQVAALLGETTQQLAPEAAARRAVGRVEELLAQVRIPTHLSEFGVAREGFDLIIEESLPSGSFKHNPSPLGAQDVRNILERAL